MDQCLYRVSANFPPASTVGHRVACQRAYGPLALSFLMGHRHGSNYLPPSVHGSMPTVLRRVSLLGLGWHCNGPLVASTVDFGWHADCQMAAATGVTMNKKRTHLQWEQWPASAANSGTPMDHQMLAICFVCPR